jgi:hypothetical protein
MQRSRACDWFLFSGAPFSEDLRARTLRDSLGGRSERLAALLLVPCAFLAALGCSRRPARAKPEFAAPLERSRIVAPPSSSSAQQPSSAGPSSIVAEAWAETNDFKLPIPAGYRNATAEFPGGGFAVVLAKNETTERYRSTIVIRRVPVPGGSFDDPSECERTGRGLIRGGTDAPGTGGTLNSARIIDGPIGKTCQIQLTAREGVAVLTELHQPENSRSSPKDIWLMTCNYADGDALAESACHLALSGFRFRNQ